MTDSQTNSGAQENAEETARRVADWMYANDPATKALGMQVEEIAPGYAQLRMTVRADMLNGHG
ncbi:MAG: hypothetical protein ABJ201_01580, partial [Nisaea sp.]